MLDFDLEAPGLENFFSQILDVETVARQPGLVDLFKLASEKSNVITFWKDYLIPIRLPRIKGKFHLLTAGSRSKDYFKNVRDLDFVEFYSTKNGGSLIEDLRNQFKDNYDFILIDSRTGLTEIGGICTVQLPDFIVLLFTATN